MVHLEYGTRVINGRRRLVGTQPQIMAHLRNRMRYSLRRWARRANVAGARRAYAVGGVPANGRARANRNRAIARLRLRARGYAGRF